MLLIQAIEVSVFGLINNSNNNPNPNPTPNVSDINWSKRLLRYNSCSCRINQYFMVTIEIRANLESYVSIEKNGVTSNSWGSWHGNFAFIR
ncbi:MAG: hypothetical protein KAH20_04415 [Methylococcales bacterium]|nr:hypothetical protein [Methylococcales bacterium]